MKILTLLFCLFILVPSAAFTQGTWVGLNPMADTIYWGACLEWDGNNYIYGFEGYNSSNSPNNNFFYRYDLTSGNWTQLASLPGSPYWGAGLARSTGDYIYALQGNGTGSFFEYNINTNNWVTAASTPETGVRRMGDCLVWAGSNYLYTFRGNGNRNFWRYDINTNTWDTLTDAPDDVRFGASCAWDGGRGDFIYALRGDSSTNFWRYHIPTDTWFIIANTPDNVEDGGALTFDGNKYFYALRGDSTREFWRYSIDDDTWIILDSTSEPVHEGGALIFAGNQIFALRGDRQKDFWRYDCVDLAVIEIDFPPDTVHPDSAIIPMIYIHNYGTSKAENFYTYCSIDSAGSIIYFDSILVDSILAGETGYLQFSTWDPSLPGGVTDSLHFYTLHPEDIDSTNDKLSKEVYVELVQGVAQDPINLNPKATVLYQNLPNPFHSETEISYHLSSASPVILKVMDISGRTVATLVDEYQSAGSYQYRWDGRDEYGNKITSGIYLYQLITSYMYLTNKMTFFR